MALFPRYLVMDPKSLGLSVLNNNKDAQKMCLCHCSTFITSPEVVNSHNMHNNTRACKNNIGFLRGKRGSRLNIGMKALNAKASYATKKSNPFPSANDGNRSSDFLGKILQDGARVLIGEMLVFSMLFWNVPDPALAADPVKTYVCLLTECRAELLHCMGDASCAAYIACIESCNNNPGETECQMKCGDLFENSAVSHLNECAVSRKKCVLKKPDDGTFPVPETRAVVEKFNIADFNGKWYITSGLNPLFDTFDCQVHEFFPLHDSLTGKWTWRISTPDGGFFTRSTVQVFDQDLQHPGILHYHDTAYLHNQDDWYVVSSKIENKLDDYIFVYYRGTNDAWDGYGGAVIYSRTPVLPSSIVPDLAIAARKVGLDFIKFQNTDNMCAPEPSILVRIQKKIKEGEQVIAKTVEVLKKKLKMETTLF